MTSSETDRASEDQEINRKLCFNLKRIRMEKGFTQTEVAKGTGIAQYSISDWEIGRRAPQFVNVLRLAQFYGISMYDLLEEIPEESQRETTIG